MKFEAAVEAARATGNFYYAAELSAATPGGPSKVAAVIDPRDEPDGAVVVHLFHDDEQGDFGFVGRIPVPETPELVKRLAYRPYVSGFWHRPLDSDLINALRRFGRRQ